VTFNNGPIREQLVPGTRVRYHPAGPGNINGTVVRHEKQLGRIRCILVRWDSGAERIVPSHRLREIR
jgi:hypothetical protein